MTNTTMICFCAICGQPVTVGQQRDGDIADHWVFELDGTLDYIEIAHKYCAERDNRARNTPKYWKYDGNC